ncbi:hypothetical protein RV00_GL001002 [Enterococcus devriesei]|uniref:Uncharacterized protein n=1 Tax=Enterococcus devriesei TaxID=319970 RepID=A0A1L8SP29_9ENTE|nr:hypothetical protein RV00_GL001002 [Enterococcus devriesei]
MIHTCDITLPGKVQVGEDSWGRPIYEDHDPKTVKCRYNAKKVYLKDTAGTEQVLEMKLFLLPETAVDPQMTVDHIKDDRKNLLTTAKLVADTITPRYDAKTLHHYEVYLKGAE